MSQQPLWLTPEGPRSSPALAIFLEFTSDAFALIQADALSPPLTFDHGEELSALTFLRTLGWRKAVMAVAGYAARGLKPRTSLFASIRRGLDANIARGEEHFLAERQVQVTARGQVNATASLNYLLAAPSAHHGSVGLSFLPDPLAAFVGESVVRRRKRGRPASLPAKVRAVGYSEGWTAIATQVQNRLRLPKRPPPRSAERYLKRCGIKVQRVGPRGRPRVKLADLSRLSFEGAHVRSPRDPR